MNGSAALQNIRVGGQSRGASDKENSVPHAPGTGDYSGRDQERASTFTDSGCERCLKVVFAVSRPVPHFDVFASLASAALSAARAPARMVAIE